MSDEAQQPAAGSEWETARAALAWRRWILDAETLLAQLPAVLDDYQTAIRSSASSQAASSVLHALERLAAQQDTLDLLREGQADMRMLLRDMQPRLETLEAQHLRRDIQVADLLAAIQRIKNREIA